MCEITKILMVRDGITKAEAEKLFNDCKTDFYNRLERGEMPYYILEEWFGIEPDYIIELV